MVNKMKRIFLGLITLMFLGSGLAYAANTYTNSAHGDSSGVDRKSPFPAYGVGNCAHCHEQHASIGGTEPAPNVDDVASLPGAQGPDNYLLFDANHTSQTLNFCFDCHVRPTSGTSYQDSSTTTDPITNYSYSRTFGGDTGNSVDNIKEAFGLASAHDLDDILTKMSGWGHFDSNSNPCSGCHNPHLVQRNFGPYNADKSALSLPSNHNELWGDTDGSPEKERMDEYATGYYYRAPFYVGADSTLQTTAHEPDGADYFYTSANGSNLTNFVDFCLDCHSSAIDGISAIPWGTSGDQHGKKTAIASQTGNRMAPYTTDGISGSGEDTDKNFVLSCMDCHEPHGSSNIKLLRTEVNKKTGISVTNWPYLENFCSGSCHKNPHSKSGGKCGNCHYHGSSNF